MSFFEGKCGDTEALYEGMKLKNMDDNWTVDIPEVGGVYWAKIHGSVVLLKLVVDRMSKRAWSGNVEIDLGGEVGKLIRWGTRGCTA